MLAGGAAAQTSNAKADPYEANNRPPDARFKADILLVVAHPDDETVVSAYLAREVVDEHKKVAVVYATRGDGGNNDVGPEQAMAMGEMREAEAREAVKTLGIENVWFLQGLDTPSQNPLNSLERWGHGACLNQLVRLVRLTRPSVILTFLPDFTTGENHGDHQAAGVLATEAFDLAGDPTVFAEQVSPVTNPEGTMNLTEGLRPWQPEKIYYFYNPSHDIFAGQGPQYRSDETSPSRHESYGMIAAEAFAKHRTQGGDKVQRAIEAHALENSNEYIVQLIKQPVKLIFGKAVVPSGTTDDVFAGVTADGVSFQRAVAEASTEGTAPSLRIGDPWNYYHAFWRAHALDHLANVVPNEITVKTGGTLFIPLIFDNPGGEALDVNITVQAPEGWEVAALDPFAVAAHAQHYLRVVARAPATMVPGWQSFTITAHGGGHDLGKVLLRAELSTGWVAAQ